MTERDATELVKSCYEAIHRRAPDPEGLKTFVPMLVSGSLSVTDFINHIMETPEWRVMSDLIEKCKQLPYDSLGNSSADEAQTFVELAYLAALRRQPDVEGIETYLTALSSGKATSLSILQELLDSPEGSALTHRLASPVLDRKAACDAEMRELINELFLGLLGRPADNESMDYHMKMLLANEASMVNVLRGIAGSEEFNLRLTGVGDHARASREMTVIGSVSLDSLILTLVNRGCQLSLPPLADGASSLSSRCVSNIIVTLAQA